MYLCIARIFVTDTKEIYNTIQYKENARIKQGGLKC